MFHNSLSCFCDISTIYLHMIPRLRRARAMHKHWTQTSQKWPCFYSFSPALLVWKC